MERLTYRDKKGEAHLHCYQMCADAHEDCDTAYEVDRCQRYVAFRKLADYEDAAEQGLLVKLPCKPGDTIYYVADGKITEKHVIGFLYTNQLYIVTEEFNFNCPAALIGHVLFITRDEAKAKLKEMESSAVEPRKE